MFTASELFMTVKIRVLILNFVVFYELLGGCNSFGGMYYLCLDCISEKCCKLTR